MAFPAGAAKLVAGFEGFRSRPYKDAGGRWTIGYGSTYLADGKTPVGPSTAPVSVSQALTLLSSTLQATYRLLSASVHVALTENQTSALLSFAYNVGITAFKGSTLLRKLNAGDYEGAANEFQRWDHDNGVVVAGLLNRRKAEQALFEAK